MIYGKKKLMKHFQEEIDRVASLELKVLQEQKESLKKEAIEAEKIKLETEFKQRYQKKVNQLDKQYANQKAHFDTVSKKEIYLKKKQFQDLVFAQVLQNIHQYVESKEYLEQLEEHFKALQNVCVFVGEKDEIFIETWQKDYPALTFEVSKQIQLGGYQIYDEQKHVLYDHSLDARFESEKKQFLAMPLNALQGGVDHE